MYRQAEWHEPLLLELSRKGRRGFLSYELAQLESLVGKAESYVPKTLQRRKLALPELSEPQVIRHFLHLSQMNYGVDSNTYPLGSCSMKYNPKLAERIASNPKLTRLHPYQPFETTQGTLKILYELSAMLAEISGTERVSLAPAAGAHGEFLGTLITRAWIEDKNETETRNEMLVPDSAHGTNPASASMAGFRVVKVPSDNQGLVSVEAVKTMVSKKTAGMMLTVPNTLGLFEKNIMQICEIVHEAGGLMYYDGANMNALLGRVRPGDMGFDIVHLNVHKTFGTPHGGGGPGAGPVGVSRELVDYLPIPLIDYNGRAYHLNFQVPKTVGRIKGFLGNVGVLVRAYLYLLMLGREGLKTVSEQAVLASNYLLRKIDSTAYRLPFNPRLPPKHEFVVSSAPLKDETGVTAGIIGKALLDEGVHAPTIYFPLTVEEALMIEPTETEPLESLEAYAAALNTVAHKARTNPESLKNVPRQTSVGRLDEVKASHPLTTYLNWRKLGRGARRREKRERRRR